MGTLKNRETHTPALSKYRFRHESCAGSHITQCPSRTSSPIIASHSKPISTLPPSSHNSPLQLGYRNALYSQNGLNLPSSPLLGPPGAGITGSNTSKLQYNVPPVCHLFLLLRPSPNSPPLPHSLPSTLRPKLHPYPFQ